MFGSHKNIYKTHFQIRSISVGSPRSIFSTTMYLTIVYNQYAKVKQCDSTKFDVSYRSEKVI